MQVQTTKLTDIRFHGRAGQGVVTASRLLGEAAIMGGKWVHAFPNFGPERMGAPVSAFTRISDEKFTVKTQVYEPDVICIIDPTLVKESKYYDGIKVGGKILVNSTVITPELKELAHKFEVWMVDGDEISRQYLGRTIANTVMLGALLKATNLVELDNLLKALYNKFPENIAKKNSQAISVAFREVIRID